jgi:hypothetical protein
MENTNLKIITSKTTNVSAAGLADGKLELRIVDGIAPFTVELKLNSNDFPYQWALTPPTRIIENIPAVTGEEDFNCIITGLPAGKYSLRTFDSGSSEIEDGEPGCLQELYSMSAFNAVSPPYATLNGSVNPMGIPTQVSFEFGETEEYRNEVQAGIVTGMAAVNVSLKLSAGDYNNVSVLKSETLYHYRVKAVTGSKTTYGLDMTFLTPSIMPIVVTLPATNIR